MESFEAIEQKEFEHLTSEIVTVGRRLVELGWTREQVLAYVKQLLTDPTGTAAGGPNSDRKEGLAMTRTRNVFLGLVILANLLTGDQNGVST